jgi:TatD DNase family protein
MVYAAVGIHPHEASHFAREAADVRSLLSEGKVVAVGEIGLDYHRDWVAGADQRTAFVEQVQWARDRDLPVSVHNRDADVDVLAILRQQGVRGVLHCFSGSWDFARSALDASMHLSFAGNLTYPKAADLREVAAKVPLDRTLIETDAPVLAPQPWRGRRNEPAFILATLEALAQVRGVSASCLATCVSRNADSLFAWRGG